MDLYRYRDVKIYERFVCGVLHELVEEQRLIEEYIDNLNVPQPLIGKLWSLLRPAPGMFLCYSRNSMYVVEAFRCQWSVCK